MTKRIAPALTVFLTLAMAASGHALATRGPKTSIPEVITVQKVGVESRPGLTEVRLRGDFPLNYLVFQPALDELVLEVRDCDASQVADALPGPTPELRELGVGTEDDGEGSPLTRFSFTLARGVTHAITPEGNDLIVRFRGSAQPAAPAAAPAVAALERPIHPPAPAVAAPKIVPAPAKHNPEAVQASIDDGRMNVQQTDASQFAERAGLPASPKGRALTGVDTTAADGGEILLLLDGPASYSSFELANPTRLVIDFQGLANEVASSSIVVDQPFLHRVRVSQFQSDPAKITRAVFDVSGSWDYDLQPSADGLRIAFEKATLPGASEYDVAGEAAPVPGIAAGKSSPAGLEPSAPVRAEEQAAVVGPDPEPATVSLDLDDYAYYSEAPPPTTAATTPAVRTAAAGLTFESRTIADDRPVYSGRRISLELVDADLKQVFRLFHDISGLNFVLDPSVGGRVTIVLDSVPWDQALDIILRNNGLDKVFENNVVRIATTGKLAEEASQRRTLKEASRLEQDPVTVSRILSYAKAEDADAIIRRLLSSRGQSFYDQRTNTLVVTDIPERVTAVNTLLDDLDARTPQVMIEARIVETSREFSRELGIQWGFTANQTDGTKFGDASFDLNLPRVPGASSLGIAFGDIGGDPWAVDIALDALETEGHGRILSAPKIVAQNNSTAIIEQGTQIPVVNTTATEISTEFVSASLKLEVTPQITAEGTIIMDIKVDNSSPDFKNTVGDTPSINTERAETRVLVEDGGTTVIGGVFLLNEGESEAGIPGFRKIPGLGWLFRSRTINKQNRELLIFITPKIAL